MWITLLKCTPDFHELI